jgi:low affinity Fe/Cu permease
LKQGRQHRSSDPQHVFDASIAPGTETDPTDRHRPVRHRVTVELCADSASRLAFESGVDGYSYEVPVTSSATDSPNDAGSVRATAARLRQRCTNLGSLRGPHHTRSSHLLHRLGDWSSKAVAGATVACLLAGWGIVGIITGFPSWGQVALYSTTSAVTVVMVFAIQHTQHREQLVTQRKLDELVRAQPGADDRLIAAEAATDAELDNLIEANDL